MKIILYTLNIHII